MESLVYKTKDVCSREIRVDYEDGIIKKVTIVGGCTGNTQGVSRLAEGRPIQEVIALLEGIKCPGSRTRDTSCPDQLAEALKSIQ